MHHIFTGLWSYALFKKKKNYRMDKETFCVMEINLKILLN